MEDVAELCLNDKQPFALWFRMAISSLFDQFPMACGLFSADGRLIEGNRIVSVFLTAKCGVAHSVQGQKIFVEAVERALAEGYCEVALPHEKDQKSVQIVLSLSAFENEPERCVLVCDHTAIAPDDRRRYTQAWLRMLTEFRNAGKAYAEKEAQFLALTELCPAGVYLSESNLIGFANRGLAQMFRFRSREEMMGLISADDLVCPEEHPAVAEQRKIVTQAGEAQYSFKARRHDGSQFVAQAWERLVQCNGRPAVLGVLTDISERRQMESELERRATSDLLTGLPNRALLFDRLHQLIARARREDELFALLFLDLDDFKQVNERAGQEVGNQVLRIAAGRFASALRSSDTLARIGSDEFAVIAESLLFGDDVGPVAQKLCEALSSPISVAGQEFQLAVSIGVALYPASGEDVDLLYRAADAAMQMAKETRRGGYVLSGAFK